MITIDDIDKFALIDKVFQTLSLEDLTAMSANDLVISKLKGIASNDPGPICTLYNELINVKSDNESLRSEINLLTVEMFALKTDLKVLIQCLNTGLGNPVTVNEFYTLKTRHQVY